MSNPRITFVLPSGGGGGGANSIVQEAIELHGMKVPVAVSVDGSNHRKFLANYPELGIAGVAVVPYSGDAELSTVLAGCDIAVATTNASVFAVEAARKLMTNGAVPAACYYVQDYEPLFYAPSSEKWRQARASFTHIPGAVLYAKTKWLQDLVYQNHGIRVLKVMPSLDHSIFFPDLSLPDRLTILAMIRPNTPRRAPRRTARILNRIVEQFGSAVSVHVFGAASEDLTDRGYELAPEIVNRGVLKRQQVPAVMRQSSLFLDLSDFQAFGRTGLEGMACGCIPVLPALGGTDEYAVHGLNAFVIDTRSDDAIWDAVQTFVAMDAGERGRMRQSALETAARFTVRSAALSENRIFSEMVSRPNAAYAAAGRREATSSK